MLNKPNGGSILLGTERITTLITPKGMKITEKQKDSLEQRIKEFLKKVFPEVEINREVFVDFVPVMSISVSYNKENVVEVKKLPIKGCFVGRIFAQPSQNNLTYFHKLDKSLVLEVQDRGQLVQVPEKDHYLMMIKLFHPGGGIEKRSDVRTGHSYSLCTKPLLGSKDFEDGECSEEWSPKMKGNQYDNDDSTDKYMNIRDRGGGCE
jgi:hypothetical protein